MTAMAIGPTCRPGACPLYVAAAGGGVWKARDALAGSPNWRICRPPSARTRSARCSWLNDPTGNTLYAGTGEPNASADSEAGVGIYKTTDGGLTWTLVPGSDVFFQRAIGQMDIDNAGNLLVPVASAVRGISSVTSGAVVERRNRASASRTRPLAAERRRVHAHPAARRRGSDPRLHDRPGRPHASRRHLRQRVLPGHLALARQRRHLVRSRRR